MWHEIFNSLLVGVGGVSVWVFKYHYQRFMAAHYLQKEADAKWKSSVDADIAELKRINGITSSAAPGKENGLDSQHDPNARHGSRVRRP